MTEETSIEKLGFNTSDKVVIDLKIIGYRKIRETYSVLSTNELFPRLSQMLSKLVICIHNRSFR
ncbi:MAG: hypothetical protein ACXADY_15650 [Candidatus Hodarchaeales archaeon]|jgi:hypothetical protein